MRIIQILNSPNWSGASSYCVNLCAQLKSRGHEILLLTEPGKALEKAKRVGIPYDDSIRLNHRNPSLYLHAIKRMGKIFSGFAPDIISSHINEGAWMAGMVARRVAPNSVIVRTRGDIDPPKGHLINRYVHHIWTDHIIVSSHLHKRICQKILDFPGEKIDVIYGAIDTDLFAPPTPPFGNFREEIKQKSGTILVALVARLDPVKGHEFALQAFKMLGSCPVPRHLVLLGYENQRTFEWVKNLSGELKISDQVTCTGYRQDLPEIIRQCDVGLISSIGSEANCRAALEFMSCGKPVVATKVGVIPEIILDGEQGILVEPNDPVEIAAALSRLMTNPILRATMGKKGRQHVLENFNLELFARRTEEVYQKAISGKRQTQPV